MKTWMLALTLLIGTITLSERAFSPLCFRSPWDVKMCTAIITYDDGTTREVAFQPKDKTIGTCYEFGCHPVYCDNWRDEIRDSCKAEYEELMRTGQSSLFTEKNKKIASVSFNGCASARSAPGVWALLDNIVRGFAPESYSHVCSVDSPEQEWSIKKELKNIWTKIRDLNHDYLRRLTSITTPGSLLEITR